MDHRSLLGSQRDRRDLRSTRRFLAAKHGQPSLATILVSLYFKEKWIGTLNPFQLLSLGLVNAPRGQMALNRRLLFPTDRRTLPKEPAEGTKGSVLAR